VLTETILGANVVSTMHLRVNWVIPAGAFENNWKLKSSIEDRIFELVFVVDIGLILFYKFERFKEV